MTTFKTALCLLTYFLAATVSAQNWSWTKTQGGTGFESANATTLDSKGNVYVIGAFSSSSMQIDNQILNNKGQRDIFVIKYNPKGGVLWAKQFGGHGNDIGYDIAVTANESIYITGQAGNSALFDSNTLSNNTSEEQFFVAKLDRDGNCLWATAEGTNFHSEGRGITIDTKTEQIFAVGAIQDKHESYAKTQIALFSYDRNGNKLQEKILSSSSNANAYDIKLDNNQIYVTGIFKGELSFSSQHITSRSYSTDGYLAAFSVDLDPKWIHTYGGDLEYDHAWAVDTDSEGNVYMCGRMQGVVLLDNIAIYTLGDSDILLTKYDSSGNLIWFRIAGGEDWEVAHALKIIDNHVWIAGIFEGQANFGTEVVYSKGAWDAFVAVYTTDGKIQTVQTLEGVQNEALYAIGSYQNTLALVGRSESSYLSFEQTNLQTNGGSDAFIAALTMNQALGNEESKENTKKILPLVYPNPVKEKLIIRFNTALEEAIQIRLYNEIGQEITNLIQLPNLHVSNQLELNTSTLAKGIYIIKISDNTQSYTQKIIIE